MNAPNSAPPSAFQEAEQLSRLIQDEVDRVFAPDNPASSLELVRTNIIDRGLVADATLESTDHSATLSVRYQNGLSEIWIFQEPPERPVYVPSARVEAQLQKLQPLTTPGARQGGKAAIIENIGFDEIWLGNLSLVRTQCKLEAFGYSVDWVDDEKFNLERLKRLNEYDVILVQTHGFTTADGHVWLQTGQSVDLSVSQDAQDYHDGLLMPCNNFVVVGIGWKKTWCVNEGYFAKYYSESGRKFTEGSIFYNASCQGYTSPSLAKTLVDQLGVGCYLGWTDSQRKGPDTASKLFGAMAGGVTLGDAYDRLPNDTKVDYTGAELKLYPETGRGIRLTDTPTATTISIDSPVSGSTVETRVVGVTGRIFNRSALGAATLSCNGECVALPVDEFGNFSQDIVVRSGRNEIVVMDDSSQSCVFATATINAEIPSVDFWSELRWDTDRTDVDLHLLPPGFSSYDSLFGSNDCYFSNRTPWWGGYLDVDDLNGYGPEHITVPAASPGTYLMCVHYYNNHGNPSPTNADLWVSVAGERPIHFGPVVLRNPWTSSSSRGGDIWQAFKIDYPSGQITAMEPVTSNEDLRSLLKTLSGNEIEKGGP